MLSVAVEDVSACDGVPGARRFEHWIGGAFGAEVDGELSIRIVAEQEARELNLRYRGRDAATNVLSFDGAETPSDVDTGTPKFIGDLVLCAPVILREAAVLRSTPDAHWAHLAIHGVLHLLGYDHEADADADRMQQREVELLARLGFDDPYAAEC